MSDIMVQVLLCVGGVLFVSMLAAVGLHWASDAFHDWRNDE